jgi:DNA excision repair protein ERCC-2
VPDGFVEALQRPPAPSTDYLAEHPTEVHGALQRFYFDALHFGRIAELFGRALAVRHDGGARSRQPAAARLCLRNVVPAPFLRRA